MLNTLKSFFKTEAASGFILLLVAALAMIVANSPLAPHYHALRTPDFTFFVNDGLMAIFFLVVGIEIKREMREGELAGKAQVILPFAAALGGILTPALIYIYINSGTPHMRGWAIPTATDIAFSLGILALFGSRISPALRIFLMAVAVIDDLAAVFIIAFFYTGDLDYLALLVSIGCVFLLAGFNRFRTDRMLPYIFAGGALWCAMAQSGVHPTIAGVLLGFLMPLDRGKILLDKLHAWVAFGIVPLFAFANAGIPLSGLTPADISSPLPLGIALGLFIGKPAGIFMASWLLIRANLARLPSISWLEFYAVCMIAGIGFTMSLFIGTLAFESDALQLTMRLGVIAGSLLSALGGIMVMAFALRNKSEG